MKLYDASRDGKIDQVDLAMQGGANVHWKNPDQYGKLLHKYFLLPNLCNDLCDYFYTDKTKF